MWCSLTAGDEAGPFLMRGRDDVGGPAAVDLPRTSRVVRRGSCEITYAAAAYQRQCSKELFKFQGR